MNQNQRQFEGSHSEDRMTGAEAEALIALWEQRHGPPPSDTASITDLAEGLGADANEVRQMLAEVRAQRLNEERLLADQKQHLAAEQHRLREVQMERARLGTNQKNSRTERIVGLVVLTLGTLLMCLFTGAFITAGTEREPEVLARLDSPLDRFWSVALLTGVGLMLLGVTLTLGLQVWKELRAWFRSR